jgi:hypothetical protein
MDMLNGSGQCLVCSIIWPQMWQHHPRSRITALDVLSGTAERFSKAFLDPPFTVLIMAGRLSHYPTNRLGGVLAVS